MRKIIFLITAILAMTVVAYESPPGPPVGELTFLIDNMVYVNSDLLVIDCPPVIMYDAVTLDVLNEYLFESRAPEIVAFDTSPLIIWSGDIKETYPPDVGLYTGTSTTHNFWIHNDAFKLLLTEPG